MFNFLASLQIVAMKNKTEINNTLQVSKNGNYRREARIAKHRKFPLR